MGRNRYSPPSRGRDSRRDSRRRRSRSASRSPPRNRSTSNNRNVARKRPDLSSSHEQSRERERRRRRTQAECIRRAGGFQKLADSEGHEPIRLFWDGFQWVAKTGQTTALQSDPALMNSTRKLRRLYFGNLPLHLGLTETGFQDIVWQEMRSRNFCNDPNSNPVLYVWFAKDKGNYGFVEFASVEETERALTMDGMNCMGIPLKVSRPNDYSTASVTQSQAMTAMGQHAAALLTGNAAAVSVPGAAPQAAVAAAGPVGTTRFLKINQVVLPESIQDDCEYKDIYEDVKEGLSEHGKILSGLIVTPIIQKSLPFSIGDMLLEFADATALDKCVAAMAGRIYEGRPIKMTRFDETSYTQYIRPILTV